MIHAGRLGMVLTESRNRPPTAGPELIQMLRPSRARDPIATRDTARHWRRTEAPQGESRRLHRVGDGQHVLIDPLEVKRAHLAGFVAVTIAANVDGDDRELLREAFNVAGAMPHTWRF